MLNKFKFREKKTTSTNTSFLSVFKQIYGIVLSTVFA